MGGKFDQFDDKTTAAKGRLDAAVDKSLSAADRPVEHPRQQNQGRAGPAEGQSRSLSAEHKGLSDKLVDSKVQKLQQAKAQSR